MIPKVFLVESSFSVYWYFSGGNIGSTGHPTLKDLVHLRIVLGKSLTIVGVVGYQFVHDGVIPRWCGVFRLGFWVAPWVNKILYNLGKRNLSYAKFILQVIRNQVQLINDPKSLPGWIQFFCVLVLLYEEPLIFILSNPVSSHCLMLVFPPTMV